MRIRFSFRWIPFFAVIAVVAVGISLGNWQWRRADEKRAIETMLSTRQSETPLIVGVAVENIDNVEYRRVVVRGEFDRDWPLYLDNRPYAGNAGFYLLMPFKIAGTDRHVMVARGWFPLVSRNRGMFPPPLTPAGPVEIQGVVRRNPGRVLQLGQPTPVHPGAILQNLTVVEFAEASGFKIQPFLIEQTGDMHDGLVRDWPRPSVGIERHLGYAFQWYGLALTAFLFFVVTGYRRGTK